MHTHATSDPAATPATLTSGLKPNLLGLNRQALEQFFAQIGESRFRAQQVLKWIHQNGAHDFAVMTNLSKSLRGRLAEVAEVRPLEAALDQTAPDGTRKWLLRLADGNCIETVFIPEEKRGTLCISSQVGCTLDCSFCSTGQQGFNRNLSTAEIVGQLWFANRALSQAPETAREERQDPGDDRHPGARQDRRMITNVVLMGMGEPLLNFDNVVAAMRLMLDDLAYGLSRRRVTLSTAGLVPLMDRLREECPVALAVSLHAPDDALRDQLVPLNKKFPIADLLAACRRYAADVPRHRITFEYVMLAGVNDSEAHAHALADLLKDVPSKVNLIPFNPFPGTRYVRSAQPVIDRFRDILLAAGLVTVTRRTRGENIDAACGQLVGQVQDRTRRLQRKRIPVQGQDA